jgi:outer membrane lipoprotein-sorting protein
MKRTSILLIAIAGISLLMAGCVSDELTSEQIAEQMREHRNDVQEYTYTLVMTDMMSNETMIVDLAYKNPGRIRMEYKEPAEVAGQLQVSNGTYTWMYDPASNTVRTAAVPADTQMDETLNARFIEEMLNTCTIEPQGKAVIDGRACYVITATPKEAGMFATSMRLWFDRATWMLLKMDTSQNGELVMRMEYRDVQLDADIPDSTFEFEVPAGATVESMDRAAPQEMTLEEAQAEVTFEIKEPDHLPPGYEMDIIMTVPVSESDKGVTTIQLIESPYNESTERPVPEGGDVETVLINGHDCTITMMQGMMGETRVLQWDDGEYDFMLAGALDQEEIIRIAESI